MDQKTLERLLDYAARDLAPDEAAGVQRDMDLDPDAAEVVAWYRLLESVLKRDDSIEPPEAAMTRCIGIFDPQQLPRPETGETPPTWLDRVDAVIAALVSDGREAVAGLRVAGGGERFNLLYQAEDTEIDLQARHVETAPDESGEQWQLMGRVSCDATGPFLAVAAVAAPAGPSKASSSDASLTRTSTDDRGSFRLKLPAGRYDLYFRIERRTVVVPDIELL